MKQMITKKFGWDSHRELKAGYRSIGYLYKPTIVYKGDAIDCTFEHKEESCPTSKEARLVAWRWIQEAWTSNAMTDADVCRRVGLFAHKPIRPECSHLQ